MNTACIKIGMLGFLLWCASLFLFNQQKSKRNYCGHNNNHRNMKVLK